MNNHKEDKDVRLAPAQDRRKGERRRSDRRDPDRPGNEGILTTRVGERRRADRRQPARKKR